MDKTYTINDVPFGYLPKSEAERLDFNADREPDAYVIDNHEVISLYHCEIETLNGIPIIDKQSLKSLAYLTHKQCENSNMPVIDEEPVAFFIEPIYFFIEEDPYIPVYDRSIINKYPIYENPKELPYGYITEDFIALFDHNHTHVGYVYDYMIDSYQKVYDVSSHSAFKEKRVHYYKKPSGFLTNLERVRLSATCNTENVHYLIDFFGNSMLVRKIFDCSEDKRWRLKAVTMDNYNPYSDEDNFV